MKYDKEILNRLKQISIENKIWIIYIGIIFLSWYSNSYEKKYFLFNDKISRKKYQELTILIFSILIIVYAHFLKSSFDDINNLKETDTKHKKNLVYLSFTGSLLIFISGLIFLYIAFSDEELNVEIAFN